MFETGDMVYSPLFGKGLVIESYWSKVVVNFENKAFWLRTVSKDIFTEDKKRLTKKKDIKPDLKEIYFNDIHDEYNFIPNDML